MRKSKFSPQQIAKILKSFDTDKSVEEICREHGISSSTFYKWRRQYAGMDGSELKRLKELEKENRKLKQTFGISAVAGFTHLIFGFNRPLFYKNTFG